MSRKLRIVIFIASIVPASSSTSATMDRVPIGEAKSNSLTARAPWTSTRNGVATSREKSHATGRLASTMTSVISNVSRLMRRASLSSSSWGDSTARWTPRGSPSTCNWETEPSHSRPATFNDNCVSGAPAPSCSITRASTGDPSSVTLASWGLLRSALSSFIRSGLS